MDIANTILESLTVNQDFVAGSLPYLKEEYFEENYQKKTFQVIRDYIEKHKSLPNQETILIDVDKHTDLTDSDYQSIVDLTASWSRDSLPKDLTWLLKNAEEWCKDRAFYLAVLKATQALDSSKGKTRGDLPELMKDALGVSFDTRVGHDFFEDWEERYTYYTDVRERIPFDIDILNKMTEGGVEKKTLNVIMGGVHTGKTRFLTHLAAAYASAGLNSVYFTMEMAEEKIAQRIDANLLGISMNDFKAMSKTAYEKAITSCKAKTKGDVVIKQFPTGSAHVGHFRHVLRELESKKNFKADVVFVDYINICASSRAKDAANSYTYVKLISEELRGLAIEFDLPLWSATQVNRDGYSSSDIDMDDVAESWGLPATCDWLGAIIVDEQLLQIEQFILKQLKSRYSDKNIYGKGMINYNNELMRMTDAPQANTGFQAPSAGPGPEPTNRPPSGNKFASIKV